MNSLKKGYFFQKEDSVELFIVPLFGKMSYSLVQEYKSEVIHKKHAFDALVVDDKFNQF